MSFGNGNGSFDPNDLKEWGERTVKQWGPRVRIVIVLGALLILAMSSYYQVEPEEVGLVLRFGQNVDTAGPGPHFKIPFVDRIIKVPVERQLKQEFGFRTARAGVQSDYNEQEDTAYESVMLTGDLNVATVEWIVQYKVRDPSKYVFRVRNVEATFHDMAEASMRQIVGDHSVTEVLTVGREAIQAKVKQYLQHLCDQYETGIQVLQLVLQDVNPPEPVKPSFNEVNQAIQEKERAINDAWAEYNRVIPEARGKAEQMVQAAEGYATERVNHAAGDVQKFLALQREYTKSPQVTRTRLYLETMTRVLPRAGSRIVVDDQLKNLLPVLPMGALGKAAQ